MDEENYEISKEDNSVLQDVDITENEDQVVDNENTEDIEDVQDNVQNETETENEVQEEQEEQKAIYSKEDMDKTINKIIAKERRKAEKESMKYIKALKTLQQAQNLNSIDEASDYLVKFYEEQGIKVKDELSDSDIDILARVEVEKLIELGDDILKEEADRITSIPEEKRTKKEKLMFNNICVKLKNIEDIKDLEKNGIDKSILYNNDFVEFSKKFTVSQKLSDIYKIYQKMNEQKQQQEIPATPGSVANTSSKNNSEYFTREEASRLTDEDFENDEIYEKYMRSRKFWK